MRDLYVSALKHYKPRAVPACLHRVGIAGALLTPESLLSEDKKMVSRTSIFALLSERAPRLLDRLHVHL